MSASACRADPVPNPEYAHWVKFKVGTVLITHTVTLLNGRIANETDTTTKLVSKAADKLVVQIQLNIAVLGHRPQAGQVTTQDIPATVENSVNAPVISPDDAKKKPERLRVNGTVYKAHEVDTDVTAIGVTIHAKTWWCDDVPGGVVKMDSTTEGQAATETHTQIVSFRPGNGK
jgi:hypothetical protein